MHQTDKLERARAAHQRLGQRIGALQTQIDKLVADLGAKDEALANARETIAHLEAELKEAKKPKPPPRTTTRKKAAEKTDDASD